MPIENGSLDDLSYVFWLDSKGIYQGCNLPFAKAAGFTTTDQILRLTTSQLPCFQHNTALANLVEKNNALIISLQEPRLFEEHWLIDGKSATWLVQKKPMFSKKNECVAVMNTAIDITHYQETQQTNYVTAKQAENVLDSIVQNIPAHIYWKNKQGVYLGCNDKQAHSLGLRNGNAVIGKTDFELPWAMEDAKKFRDNDLLIMSGNKAELFEEPATVDGRPATVLSLKAPLKDRDSNEVVGMIGISIDISKQKEFEQQLMQAKERAETADQSKTEFLENMRHDIRTPLVGILGFAQILKREVQEPRAKEYIDSLVMSCEALTDLLNDILEVVRIGSGEVPLRKNKFSLEKTLDRVVQLNQARAHEKGLQLSFHYDQELPNHVFGDSARLYRIALEFVTNALNFTHHGRVDVLAECAKKTDRTTLLRLQVSDTGIGIPKEKQSDIFLQFKRLTPAYEGVYKGSGLGLSVVKQFVEELEGEIYVESELGKGTTFTCLIPLQNALLDDDFGAEDNLLPTDLLVPNKIAPAIPQNEPRSDSTQKRVLLVEDQTIAATVVLHMLQDLNCHVDLASTGQMAIQLYKAHRYDLIFMDIGLSDLNGYEVTRRVRLIELQGDKHVPIIALTAHVDEENKQSCIDAGMNAVLSKPLSKEKAADILNAFIPHWQPHPSETPETKTSSDDGNPLFDHQWALEHLGKESLVTEMLMLLMKGLADDKPKLETMHTEKNWALIKDLVHKLKGGAGYCGALRLKETCAQLLSAIRSNETNQYERLYQQLRIDMEKTDQVVRRQLGL